MAAWVSAIDELESSLAFAFAFPLAVGLVVVVEVVLSAALALGLVRSSLLLPTTTAPSVSAWHIISVGRTAIPTSYFGRA